MAACVGDIYNTSGCSWGWETVGANQGDICFGFFFLLDQSWATYIPIL